MDAPPPSKYKEVSQLLTYPNVEAFPLLGPVLQRLEKDSHQFTRDHHQQIQSICQSQETLIQETGTVGRKRKYAKAAAPQVKEAEEEKKPLLYFVCYGKEAGCLQVGASEKQIEMLMIGSFFARVWKRSKGGSYYTSLTCMFPNEGDRIHGLPVLFYKKNGGNSAWRWEFNPGLVESLLEARKGIDATFTLLRHFYPFKADLEKLTKLKEEEFDQKFTHAQNLLHVVHHNCNTCGVEPIGAIYASSKNIVQCLACARGSKGKDFSKHAGKTPDNKKLPGVLAGHSTFVLYPLETIHFLKWLLEELAAYEDVPKGYHSDLSFCEASSLSLLSLCGKGVVRKEGFFSKQEMHARWSDWDKDLTANFDKKSVELPGPDKDIKAYTLQNLQPKPGCSWEDGKIGQMLKKARKDVGAQVISRESISWNNQGLFADPWSLFPIGAGSGVHSEPSGARNFGNTVAPKNYKRPSPPKDTRVAEEAPPPNIFASWLCVDPIVLPEALKQLKLITPKKEAPGITVPISYKVMVQLVNILSKMKEEKKLLVDEDSWQPAKIVHQGPGDLIAVPVGFAHAVVNHSPNIKVAFDCIEKDTLHRNLPSKIFAGPCTRRRS